jgi:hypothetical protein
VWLPACHCKVCIVVYAGLMKRTNIFLTEEQLKKLAARSQKTGASVAEIVRRAIDAYLKKSAVAALLVLITCVLAASTAFASDEPPLEFYVVYQRVAATKDKPETLLLIHEWKGGAGSNTLTVTCEATIKYHPFEVYHNCPFEVMSLYSMKREGDTIIFEDRGEQRHLLSIMTITDERPTK